MRWIKMKKYISRVTLFLCFFAFFKTGFSQDANEQAENFYRQFLDVYRDVNSSANDLLQSAQLLSSAFELSPNTYKYSYSLGALYHSLADYEHAVQWFKTARNLATTPEQQFAISTAIEECLTELAKIKVSDRTSAGVEISFIMKLGSMEMEHGLIELLPQNLPIVEENRIDVLIDSIKIIFPQCETEYFFPFLLIGFEGREELENHLEKGVKDFYSFFVNKFFKAEYKRPIVLFISPRPWEIVEATEKLYPDINLPTYAPFLGYFNPKDNLIMATGGSSGYGTVLHEMVHALMAVDFPDAPLWFNEGLASLYERTEWCNGTLKGLPNWRFDRLKDENVKTLSELAQIDFGDEYSAMLVRFIFLFFDNKNLLSDVYRCAKEKGHSISVSDIVDEFQLSEQEWLTFVRETLREYRAEMIATSGRPVNQDEIRYIQMALNAVIGAELKTDGLWGPGTEGKLKEFQQKYGLEPDGIPGSKTKAELKRQYALTNFETM